MATTTPRRATSNGRASTNRRSSGGGADAARRSAGKAVAPAVAGGTAAVAGLAAGALLGARRRGRRQHLLGVPMPRGSELAAGAKHAAHAGRWLVDLQDDVRAVRAQAAQTRRQSPIEVLLTGLTSRRLPRRDSIG